MRGRTEKLDRILGSINANFGQDWKKTTDDVFDEVTLRNLQQLISQGIINTVENVIATGKEGNVFRAKTIKGENRAVKIYRYVLKLSKIFIPIFFTGKLNSAF